MTRLSTLFLYCTLLNQIYASIRFTNIKCEEYDPKFATIVICRLNMISRGVVVVNVHVKLFQIPVSNVTLNLSLHKRASGYRPFLYNVTTDFCKFMANRKRYPFEKIFFDLLLKESNINHTCPYDHDIIVKNLIFSDDEFKYLPLPNGEYMFQLLVAAYNDWKAKVNAYILIKDLSKMVK